MAVIRIPKSWQLAERLATPEDLVLDRRRFLRALCSGAASLVTAPLLAGSVDAQGRDPAIASKADPLATIEAGSPNADLYPAKRVDRYTLDRPLTDEVVAATHNNYYEFTPNKKLVWRLVDGLRTRPWTIEVGGLCDNPGRHDVDRLARRLGVEERLYRLRCIEAWSMAVPWTGFPLRRLVELASPTSKARFVSFTSFLDRDAAQGQKVRDYPWPYYEGLTIEEAMNELAFVATGIYGHELPKQHGAPMRLVVPWKYGFKSIKAIVRIAFTADRPRTFWDDVVPSEHDFFANVRPDVPHPRWSQAHETMIGTGERRPTLMYNGYADLVAHMYEHEGG